MSFILSLELELDMKGVVSFYTKEIDGTKLHHIKSYALKQEMVASKGPPI